MGILTFQRTNKIRFYAKASLEQLLIPNRWYRSRLCEALGRICEYDSDYIQDRVEYYNQLESPFTLSNSSIALKDLKRDMASAYYYDYRSLLRYFPSGTLADAEFGDVSENLNRPTLVKSRPIGEGNENNVLLKLNQVRHFLPIRDPFAYEDKKSLLVWRGAGWQQHRKAFLKTYWNHPLCDVGMVNPTRDPDHRQEWVKPKMTVGEQLGFKFILSIEGNDVATNLKWIAQSNSLCFMAKPKFETWMMEGRLVGGEHYVELRDDYADLSEKVEYYSEHPEEAKMIIRNFQDYYCQFTDGVAEELISLLVVKKYLEFSGQAGAVGNE